MLMLFIEVITSGASALIERARMVFLLGGKCHASDILKEWTQDTPNYFVNTLLDFVPSQAQ